MIQCRAYRGLFDAGSRHFYLFYPEPVWTATCRWIEYIFSIKWRCRVELATKVREDFTITELRHEKVPIRAFTWLISSDTMDDLWSPRWHSALSARQDTGESGGVWCDHLVVALLWIILYWILTSQLPNQNYSNTASNWGLNRNCYITASLTTRASNKGSQRFHNNWVGPYTRAFSWLKAPTMLIGR